VDGDEHLVAFVVAVEIVGSHQCVDEGLMVSHFEDLWSRYVNCCSEVVRLAVVRLAMDCSLSDAVGLLCIPPSRQGFRGEDVIHWDCRLGWTWIETSVQRLTPIELVNMVFDNNVQQRFDRGNG